MTHEEIKNLNKDDLIKFAQEFNIWKSYTFPEYVETRDIILEQMSKYGISEEEVQIVRNVVAINIRTSYK